MAFHYNIHNSNDLLLTVTRKQSKLFKRCLLLTALALSGAGIWLGLKATSAASPQPLTSVPVAALTPTSAAAPVPAQTTAKQPVILAAAANKPAVTAKADTGPQWQTITLKKGDTLGKVFAKLGISAQQLHALLQLKEVNSSLKKLQPGNQIKVQISADKKLHHLSYALNALDTLEVSRSNDSLKANIIHLKPDTQLTYASATVVHSLAQATRQAGLQGKLITQLAHIFKDKVQLSSARPGDKIKVLFEEDYIHGKKIRTGNIVAASLNLHGKAYKAVRYVDAKGNIDYYTPEGLSLKRGFIRYPVNYTYISSGFSHNRFDPVLHRMASHEAIDFAAPAGTPIKASGDGKISFAGKKGGYGNMVMIQHDRKFASLYAHLQRFASNIRPGVPVKQGQVIGYVGQTGMATGPHLHYEFHINGVKHNPLTIDLPSAAPLSRLARNKFIPQARQLMARLEGEQKIRLAENTHADTNG